MIIKDYEFAFSPTIEGYYLRCKICEKYVVTSIYDDMPLGVLFELIKIHEESHGD